MISWGFVVGIWASRYPKEHKIIKERFKLIFHNRYYLQHYAQVEELRHQYLDGKVTKEQAVSEFTRLMEVALEETTPESLEVLKVLNR